MAIKSDSLIQDVNVLREIIVTLMVQNPDNGIYSLSREIGMHHWTFSKFLKGGDINLKTVLKLNKYLESKGIKHGI